MPPRTSKQEIPAELQETVDLIHNAENFAALAKDLGYVPAPVNKPVKVHLSRPLAGGSSKVLGQLDSGRGVVALKIGKDDVEFSIHSQLVLYWVFVK